MWVNSLAVHQSRPAPRPHCIPPHHTWREGGEGGERREGGGGGERRGRRGRRGKERREGKKEGERAGGASPEMSHVRAFRTGGAEHTHTNSADPLAST